MFFFTSYKVDFTSDISKLFTFKGNVCFFPHNIKAPYTQNDLLYSETNFVYHITFHIQNADF
jgi:hypothetical protein